MLGRRGDVVLMTVFFTAALVTVLTAAVALGLRVLVLRALGAVAADAVIKCDSFDSSNIAIKKHPVWVLGTVCQLVHIPFRKSCIASTYSVYVPLNHSGLT